MKALRVDLRGVADPNECISRVLEVRLSEALALAPELETGSKIGLHAFRIACKRLRYALERFTSLVPELEALAQSLALVQNSLGEVHDRDVLLAILPPSLAVTERTLVAQRQELVEQSKALWQTARAALMRYSSRRLLEPAPVMAVVDADAGAGVREHHR